MNHNTKPMKFGFFDDQNREYVITDPKTPWPWINYLGNDRFFSLISNTGGGYSFCKDARFRRINRFRYNNVPIDDMTNFQRNYSIGEVEIEGSTLYHKTEYRERRNHYAFYSVNAKIDGFDTDRESFQVINKTKSHELIEKFNTTEKVNRAFDALKTYWDELLANFTVTSHDPRLDRMVNTWNPYQNMVTFNLSRSASYFESGIVRGMGFRDSNQDLIGFVHLIPGKARERILDLAATQLENGGAYHHQPLTKKGNSDIGGDFNDDPLWLILSTTTYIKETGDFSILEENVPYNNDPSKAQPLLHHLQKSFEHVLENLGPHGLPLIGRADWNDCLNLNCFSTNPDERENHPAAKNIHMPR